MVSSSAGWVRGAVVGGGWLLGFGAVGVVRACSVCGVSAGGGAGWLRAVARWPAGWPGAVSGGALVGGGLRLPFFALEDGRAKGMAYEFIVPSGITAPHKSASVRSALSSFALIRFAALKSAP